MSATIVGLTSVFLIFLILLSAFVYILVYQPLNTTLPPELDPPVTPVVPLDLTYRCEINSDCSSGECDQYLGVCVLPDNSQCKSSSECLSTSYCSGVCIPRTNPPNYLADLKKPGQYCPCSEGYECVNFQCYKSAGVRCDSNEECVSDLCLATGTSSVKTCSDTKSNGYTCTSNDQCSSKNCIGETSDTKVCQPAGLNTGSNGSYCGTPKDDNDFVITCNSGLSCTINNECTTNVSNFIDGCSENLACSDKYNCYEIPASNSGNSLQPCSSESDYCSCLFEYDISTQYPQPNSISSIGNCTNSFTKNIINNDNIRCLANIDVFCDKSSDCNTGNCTSSPKVYQANIDLPSSSLDVSFDNLEDATQRTYPITGLTSMINLNYTPIDNIPSKRLFGYTYFYSPLGKLDSEYDEVFSFTPENTIYSIRNKQYLYLSILNPGLILEEVLDVDATIINNNSFILAVCLVSTSTGKKYIQLFTMTEYGTLQSYDSLQLSPPDLNTSIVRLSVVASSMGNNLVVPQYLLVVKTTTSGKSDSLYFNGNPIQNPFESDTPDWNTITLNHGLIRGNGNDGNLQSYRLISYISTDGFLRFTKSIDGTLTPRGGYSSLKYPYSSGFSYLVSAFAICNIDPIILGYSNIILSAAIRTDSITRTNTFYYINDGSESVIPGYPGNDGFFLMTSSEFYFYSPRSCSSS